MGEGAIVIFIGCSEVVDISTDIVEFVVVMIVAVFDVIVEALVFDVSTVIVEVVVLMIVAVFDVLVGSDVVDI